MFFLSAPAAGQRKSGWSPPADVFRSRDGWLIRFELAGVRMEDVEVNVSRRAISVSGVRRDYTLEEGCSFYSMEISFSRFERTIELPCDLDGARVRVDYRDGLLLVRIATRQACPEADNPERTNE